MDDVKMQQQRTRQIKTLRTTMIGNKKFGAYSEAQVCKKFNREKLEDCTTDELTSIIQGLNQVAEGEKNKK
jgi:hypothetical protein